MLRGRTEAQDVLALTDVSIAVAPGEAVGLVGRNGSGKSTLLRLIAGIIKPTEGQVSVGGRIGSLLELGAGFHPDFSGRENVFLNGSIQGLRRAQIRERFDEIVAFAELEDSIDRPVRTYSSGMYMRLGFAIAAHLDADVLLLDEVFAVGDEAFQRKCFGKIFEFKQRGGTIVFVSHDATQVERLCERAVLLREGRVDFDGPTHEAIVRYRRVLAAEADPAERAAGLREWGTRRGDDRRRRASSGRTGRNGGSSSRASRSRCACGSRPRTAMPPPRLQLELRDEAGLLVASDVVDRPRSAGTPAAVRALRRRALPLSDGRFHLRLGLADARGERLLHWLDDALDFLVYPAGEERGVVRLEGSWTAEENTAREPMSSRTCPDWPNLMEFAPDLQFMHYTVAEAKLPVDALTTITHVSLGDVAICCDLERHVFYAPHTDPEVAEALRSANGGPRLQFLDFQLHLLLPPCWPRPSRPPAGSRRPTGSRPGQVQVSVEDGAAPPQQAFALPIVSPVAGRQLEVCGRDSRPRSTSTLLASIAANCGAKP